MQLSIHSGDILDHAVDVLACTANPQLNLSGGVGGSILLRGGNDLQTELHEYVKSLPQPAVPPGTIVKTGPGPLAVNHILHCVAVDVFYDCNLEVVTKLLVDAFHLAEELQATTMAIPSIATGYGPLSMEEFAQALTNALAIHIPNIEELKVVLWKEESAKIVYQMLQNALDSMGPDVSLTFA